jgi:RNA polymerase sigma-70 factor, ECF subfamily
MRDQEARVADWFRRIQEEDSAALAEMFDHFRPRLEQVVQLRMSPRLASRVDASDVLQETYLDACRQVASLQNLQPQQAFIWLRGLAIQRLSKTVRLHLGTQRRDAGRELQLPDRSSADLARLLAASQSTPSRVVQAREIAGRLRAALDQLKDEDREVIVLRHFEGLSNQEIAELLKLSNSGATMRYGRALVRLKEQLAFLSGGSS